MEEIKNHKFFWPLAIITFLTFNVIMNGFLINRQVKIELKKLSSPYGPSPQGPSLDHDRIEKVDTSIWER